MLVLSLLNGHSIHSYLSLILSVLTAIFPGEPGLAGFIAAKDDGSGGGDNWNYKTFNAPVKLSPPINQHPTFYRPDVLPVTQPTVLNHWRERLPLPLKITVINDTPVLDYGNQICVWTI